MNISRIRQLAEFMLTLPPAKYDQTTFYEGQEILSFGEMLKCDTKACIAGWACALFAPDAKITILTIADLAQELLDLEEVQAILLFLSSPLVDYDPVTQATTQDAAYVLSNLAETGQVDWGSASPKG